MTIFNFGVDFETESEARRFKTAIEVQAYFTHELVQEGERVSFIGQQSRTEDLIKYAESRDEPIVIEVWPMGLDYDEAEKSGDLEVYEINA